MNKIAKQLFLIAKQLDTIYEKDKRSTHISSNMNRNAGWLSNFFNKGITKKSAENIKKAIDDMLEDGGAKAFVMVLTGDVNWIGSKLQILKKTKQTNEVYDQLMNFIKQVYDKIPKSAKQKAKKTAKTDLEEQVKTDQTLKSIVEQFAKSFRNLYSWLDKAKQDAGLNTESWQDAFKGFKIVDPE